MLLTDGRPPADAIWIEPKWDGARSLVTVTGGTIHIRSRNGHDVTDCYPELHRLPDVVASIDAVFDAEVIALDADARCNFQRLQRRMNRHRPSAATVAATPVYLVVFDLLWLNGADLTGRPLSERRALLESFPFGASHWQLTPRFDGPLTDELLDACRQARMEGVVVKRDGLYRPGVRSKDWVKVKFRRTMQVVIGGVSTERVRAGAFAVGAYRDGRFHYLGQVGNSLPRVQAGQLTGFLRTIGQDVSPFDDLEPGPVRFVRPHVVLDVSFVEVTDAGTMRQPVLVAVRPDIDASTVELTDEFVSVITGRRSVRVAARQRL